MAPPFSPTLADDNPAARERHVTKDKHNDNDKEGWKWGKVPAGESPPSFDVPNPTQPLHSVVDMPRHHSFERW